MKNALEKSIKKFKLKLNSNLERIDKLDDNKIKKYTPYTFLLIDN